MWMLYTFSYTCHKPTVYSPISTLCGATRAMAGDPGSALLLFSCRAALDPEFIPKPVTTVGATPASGAYGIGKLISLLEMWRSGLVASPSVWMSFSLTAFLLRRLLISIMFPMISTGPVRVFFLGERSSFSFFRYEAGAQPSLPWYLQHISRSITHFQNMGGITNKIH